MLSIDPSSGSPHGGVWCRFRWALAVSIHALVLSAVLPGQPRLEAQSGHWEYVDLTRYGYDKALPTVAYDAWGGLHAVYITENPRRSGRQLFYINDAAGRFTAPIQATDTGVVLDSSGAQISPYVYKLDHRSTVHLAFAANVGNRYNLYYISNAGHSFGNATLLTRLFRYDMAVDTNGVAHVVWMDTSNSVARLYHWASILAGPPELVAQVNCPVPTLDCRLGTPDVEVVGGKLFVAFRADSGTVYVTSSQASGFGPVARLAAPSWPRRPGRPSPPDLRLRMAVDGAGTMHILAPTSDSNGADRMMYIRSGPGGTGWTYIGASLDARISEFEIMYDGATRLATLWATETATPPTFLPKNTLGEIAPQSGLYTAIGDVGTFTLPPQVERRFASGLALYGDRIAVSVSRPAPSDSATVQAGLFTRTSVRPLIRYLLPDAAAPGMNIVVGAFAGRREDGAFGKDGFHGDSVSMELVNASDASRILVGPSVVSWNGRLVSTMIFVRPGAAVGPVPLRLRIQGVASSVDTFFIVRPQSFGVNGVVSGGGLFTTGRSKRGVLVVDSLILSNGVYAFDTVDIDPTTSGNQSFLPVTLLSHGRFAIDSSATLTLSARQDSLLRQFGIGGPGGGGGGTGSEFVGGPGFAGGGGIVRGNDSSLYALSIGTGGVRSGFWNGGGSIGGAPGGATQVDVPGGGGTGHPFGASGLAGRNHPTQPLVLQPGSFGGGSGGGRGLVPGQESTGGGGGANGAGGEGGGDLVYSNAGLPVGNRQLVPLAGGSGGGGGGFASGGYGNGGGGGGAIAILSFGDVLIDGTIEANGGSGVNASVADNASGGGGGAGGSIHLGATLGIVFGPHARLLAAGGSGGPGNRRIGLTGRDGGDGGDGRIRLDGRLVGPIPQIVAATSYSAATTASSAHVAARQGTTIRGSGLPGSTVRLFVRPESATRWDYKTFRQTTVAADSGWSIVLGPEVSEGRLYLVAMQNVASPSSDPFVAEPAWVMSAVGGNYLGRPDVALGLDTIRFPCIHFSKCDSIALTISNPGIQADLQIRAVSILGPGFNAFTVTPSTTSIPAGGKRTLNVHFCPGDTGRFDADLLITTNVFPDSLRSVHLTGCAVTGAAVAPEAIDLGNVCPGVCNEATIPIRNSGTAPLQLMTIDPLDPASLGLTLLSPSLPITIEPAGELNALLRLCPKKFDPETSRIRLRTNGVDSVRIVTVTARNIGPVPDVPARVDFGTVDLGSGDSCIVQVVSIVNRSPVRPLSIEVVELISRRFRLLDTIEPGREIPPGGRLDLRVTFCADTAGTFRGQVRLVFAGGECAIDTVIVLEGSAARRVAELVLVRPESRQLVFAPVEVGTRTPTQAIVIRNVGVAPATLLAPLRQPRGGTSDSEIHADYRGVSYPYDIVPGDSVVLDVSLQPADQGEVEGVMLFESPALGWSDSVRLFGWGTTPGLYVSVPRMDFGARRIGDSASARINIGNNGTAPLRLLELRIDDPKRFTVVSVTPPLPGYLLPGSAEVVVQLLFKPDADRAFTSMMQVVADHDSHSVTLTGTGRLEQIAVTPVAADFGCRPPRPVDSIDAIMVSNPGTWPLTIDSVVIVGDTEFKLGAESFPQSIPPAGSRYYSIRFTPDRQVSTARVVVFSSTGNTSEVRLSGRRCDSSAALTMSISVPDVSGHVGEFTTLPLLARINRPVASQVDYEVRIRYDPRVAAFPIEGQVHPLTAGTMSVSASTNEDSPGELIVRGTIGPGLVSDTLVGIAVLPLLGPSRTTPLLPSYASWSTVGILSIADSGLLTVIDCDSNGTVAVGGVYALWQNRPNPFSASTAIPFSLAFQERARLTLYNSMGNPVRILLDCELAAGEHAFVMDRADLASGVYYFELRAGRFRTMLRMVLLE